MLSARGRDLIGASQVARLSVRAAVVGDYHERLQTFFPGLDSELGRLVEAADFRFEAQTVN